MVFITSVTLANATVNPLLLPAGVIPLKRVRGALVESQSGRAGLMTKQKRGFWMYPRKSITEKREKEKKECKPLKMKNKTESPLQSKGFFLACNSLVFMPLCIYAL